MLTYTGEAEKTINQQKIEVFYDMGDVKREFKVLGLLNGSNDGNFRVHNSADDIKRSMLLFGQNKGADAILFEDINEFDRGDSYIVRLKAKLLKYLDKEE
ncbi:MAG: hypothetical protein Tsb004_12810 [Allomuricauda sp.]